MPSLVQRSHSLPKELQQVKCSEPLPSEKEAPPQTNKPTKSVHFAPYVAVKEVPHYLEMSTEDIENTWLSREECKIIKQRVVALLRLMIEERVEKGECTRGLENRVPEKAKLKKENKLNAFQVVWNAQEAQYADGIMDEEAIAILCQMQTLKSREAARDRGIHDEKEVFKQ
jgi:hypothetical protein